MEVMRPNQLVVDDIVLLEVSVGRFYDMVGKTASNWSSLRAVFRLEAISLLRRHDAVPVVEEQPKAGPSKKKIVPMDVSM